MPEKMLPEEEKKKEQPTDEQKISLKHIRGEGFAIYYTNGVQISGTPWDIQFIFEQIIAPPSGGEVKQLIAQQHFAVIMSREHAKAFLDLFQRQLKKVEKLGPDVEPVAE